MLTYTHAWIYICMTTTGQVVTVSQTPQTAVLEPGSAFRLTCEQQGTVHDNMFLYKQEPRQSLRLVAFSYHTHYQEQEEGFETGYTVERPSLAELTLWIHSLTSGDAAVYVCATGAAQ